MRNFAMALLFILPFALTSQNYYVISVKGKVYLNDQLLEKKDKLEPGAQLKFSSKDDVVFVLSPEKGYFVISPQASARQSGKMEFLLAVKDALVPPDKFYSTSTRSNSPLGAWQIDGWFELQAFFRDRVLVLDTLQIPINTNAIFTDSLRYFALIAGETDSLSVHPIPFQENKLLFDQSWVMDWKKSLDSPGRIEQEELYYLDLPLERQRLIGTFQFVFTSGKDLLEELTQIKTAFKSIERHDFFFEHALPYVGTMYGQTNPDRVWDLTGALYKEQ